MAETSLQNDSNQNPRITWEGCSVLLDINDGDRLVFARLSAASSLKIGDKKCSLSPLIGCPFGSLFQVETGSKGPYLSRITAASEGDIQEKIDVQLKDETKDNRALVDNNSAQTLSGEDIEAMRRQGATGDEIVEALIANSSTFEKKTSFSQEKYRIKKQKKYAPRVLLRRPFSRSICEAYFKKYPNRIGYLRVDTLSLLLSMANVSAYSDVLVVDMVGGILTGAVAERLGGHGYVCNTYFGATQYPMDIVRIFNLNNKICSSILRSPVSDLCSALSNCSEHLGQQETFSLQSESDMGESISSGVSLIEPEGQDVQTETSFQSVEPSMLCQVPMSTDEIVASSVSRACKPAKPGEKATQEILNLWKSNGFSSLIIAAPELDTWSTVKDLLPLLSYSAPFAIYHQYLQPLATCMHNLQVSKMAISLQISEPWLREYQVLPSRSHPFMQMSAFGGYILSGIKICNNEAQNQSK
ncbi:tRNA (adenine(58)-N(1))-methyltransferase non-catalytic subunit TRM6 [Thalictrum thalictroides]|uniref:tRNA (adenine(58)-N(1))-methyltransferase non-catalytic subunit TRM6 n=1 Tax=Thalictrum thalictroides TaxID=46969 RepID=A0A7J6WQ44_THATH|nr:tRNA (adenine(58)-N(1))-methyltransferase non-catalytic subunit TRM6 [Thalictrum thalictroides]